MAGQDQETTAIVKSLDDRRKAVKALFGAGGVVVAGKYSSSDWIRPAIEIAVLPAHARISSVGFDESLEDPCEMRVVCTGTATANITVSGYVIPPTNNVKVSIRLDRVSGATTNITTLNTETDSNGDYEDTESNVGLNLAVNSLVATITLPDYPEAGSAVCSISPGDSGPHYGYGDNDYFCSTFT